MPELDRRALNTRLSEILGDDAADTWLASGHPALGRRPPIEAWMDGDREAVHAAVDALAAEAA